MEDTQRQFVESLKRLYEQGEVDQSKILQLFVLKKITNEEKWYILKQD